MPAGHERERAAAEEAALISRVAAGDRADPLVALYRRYWRRLYGLGLQMLGDKGMAEELVQETFVRLWRSAGRFDPAKGSAQTFVFTIARRTAIDLLRRSRARPMLPLSVPAGEPKEGESSGISDDEFDRLLLGLDVREALNSLSSKHREVLELYAEEDLSQPEIADRLGVPLGTVKTRTYYGLRALKHELEERDLIG